LRATDRVREIVLPIIEAADASLYDVEHESGILRVMVDREGGIDVDTIGDLSQQISAALDHDDPFPNQRYLLEVTSPGIERKLRLPEHFQAHIGSDVNIKVRDPIEGERRFEGRLDIVDDTGIEITLASGDEPVTRRIAFQNVDTARTIFHWASEEQTSTKNKSTNKKASTR